MKPTRAAAFPKASGGWGKGETLIFDGGTLLLLGCWEEMP